MREAVADHVAFEDYLARFCAPIYRLRSPGSTLPPDEEKNGTCALINTGKEKLFVTCHHVWDGWKIFQLKDPEAELWLGLDDGVLLNLTNAETLDSDEGLDLAIIKADVDHLQLRTKAFYQIQEWPIPLPKVGEVVALMGFTGTGRIPFGQCVIEWRSSFLGCCVSSVTERNITLAPERRDRKNYDENWEEIPHGDVGGMSGSPAWLLRDVGLPSLAGFLYEGRSSDDFIFLTPARYLQPDGTLRGW